MSPANQIIRTLLGVFLVVIVTLLAVRYTRGYGIGLEAVKSILAVAMTGYLVATVVALRAIGRGPRE